MAPPRRLRETLVAVQSSATNGTKRRVLRFAAAPASPARSVERRAIGAARHQAIFQFSRRVELVGQQPADQEQRHHHAERDQRTPLAAIRAVAVCHCDVIRLVGRRGYDVFSRQEFSPGETAADTLRLRSPPSPYADASTVT